MSDQPHVIEGERGVSEVATPPRISRRQGLYLIGVSAIVGFVYFVWGGGSFHKQVQQPPPPTIAATTPLDVATEPPPPRPTPQQPPPTSPPPSTQTRQQQGDPLDAVRKTPPLGSKDEAKQEHAATAGSPAAAANVATAAQRESELASKLHATVLEGTKAVVLKHPEYVVTMGTAIPCVLQTAMQSDAPGIVICITQYDVLGSTGTVTVMEKGTKMVGEYGHDMQQGQERLFVLWNRAETPEHVVITLGSPGADGLGTAGFGGFVDTHDWQRYKGALMLTLIDGAFSLATSALSKNGSTNLNLGTGESAATTALQNSINIPPTLKKNQGDIVSVMVARDLDFADVYKLSLR